MKFLWKSVRIKRSQACNTVIDQRHISAFGGGSILRETKIRITVTNGALTIRTEGWYKVRHVNVDYSFRLSPR